MHKIQVVAKMVFRKRVKSPTYYWMILAPILLLAVTVGFTKYMQSQNNHYPAIIGVEANRNIQEALIAQKNKAYQINEKVIDDSPERLKMHLEDGTINGILKVNDDFSKILFLYNAKSDANDPTQSLIKNLTTLKSQSVAIKHGINQQEWKQIIQPVNLKKDSLNGNNTVGINNSAVSQYISELSVIIAFFFLTSYISITGVEIGNEKGNHLIEGVLSAIPANKHFAGKMLGILYLVIFQLLIYGAIGTLGYCIIQYFKLRLFDLNKYVSHVSLQYYLIVVLLTILSIILYVLLAAIFASFVSRTEDISQATSSVASLMLIPYFISFFTQDNPNLLIAKILSYVPYLNQGIMPVRIARGSATYTEGYWSILITTIGVFIMYFLAQQVYKNNAIYYSEKSPIKMMLNQLKF